MQNVVVYREPGRFAGWPANHGIWSWGDEIVVAFTLGYHLSGPGFHARDKSRPSVIVQSRSLDGGLTWSAPAQVAAPVPVAARVAASGAEGEAVPPPSIDLREPNVALMCALSGLSAGGASWLYVSTDRCRTWRGPYRLPSFGQPGLEARTEYDIDRDGNCTLFLTAAKQNGEEGRVFCARADRGSLDFKFVAWIGPEPTGYTIMPATVRLSDQRLVAAVRRYEPHPDRTVKANGWIELYASRDNGSTWAHVGTPVGNTGTGGNPPTLTRLTDGRLVLIYGYRAEPFGLRAKISGDAGESWGDELVLRADGGCADLGYPRTALRPDGCLVTVYYYNDRPDGERYIAATVWRP